MEPTNYLRFEIVLVQILKIINKFAFTLFYKLNCKTLKYIEISLCFFIHSSLQKFIFN